MALLGELAVNIVARTQKFSAGMTGASKKVKGFQKDVSATSKGLGMMRTALAGLLVGFSVRAITKEFFELAESMDRVAKQAKQIGIDATELEALGHAAKLSGTSTETLTKSLARMARTFSDARQGTKESLDAFQELGISFENVARLKPEEQLGIIADALGQIKDNTQKIDLAQTIFGRGGLEMIPLLKEGAAGIRALTDEAKELGIAAGGHADMEKFNDEMTRLSGLLGGLKRGFIIDVSPVLAETVEGLRLITQAKVGGGKPKTGFGDRLSNFRFSTKTLLPSGMRTPGQRFLEATLDEVIKQRTQDKIMESIGGGVAMGRGAPAPKRRLLSSNIPLNLPAGFLQPLNNTGMNIQHGNARNPSSLQDRDRLRELYLQRSAEAAEKTFQELQKLNSKEDEATVSIPLVP